MYELRWYQTEAVNSLFEFFAHNKTGNPVVAMPTGTGKSLVIGEFVRTVMTNWPTQRIIMLTHVKELIEQNAEKLWSLWPQAPLGIFSAGLKTKDAYHPVTFGGVQSVARLLAKEPDALGHRDLVIIDECHLLSPKNTSQYQQVIGHLKAINPYLRVIGLTATPFRLKVGMITEGEGLFDAMAYNLCSVENFNRLLAEGYLAPLIPKKPNVMIDTSKVRLVAGEFNSKELEEASDRNEITEAAVKEMIAYGHDRRSWLVFAAGIDHAEHIADCLRYYGVNAAASHSKLSNDENRHIIEAFKDGEIRALVNNNKFTTGFDHPPVDMIGMLRPTMSPGLWVQMLGRGTRPSEGKANTLVLDFAGNTARLGPINDPIIPMKPRKGAPGEAPVKVCESCGCYNHTSARVCAICGVEFVFQNKLTSVASQEELIRLTRAAEVTGENMPENKIVEHEVSHVIYDEYVSNKPNAKPTLRVTYVTVQGKLFREWLCFSHVGIMRQRANAWWLRRAKGEPLPIDTKDARSKAHKLVQPTSIKVSEGSGKWPDIVGATL